MVHTEVLKMMSSDSVSHIAVMKQTNNSHGWTAIPEELCSEGDMSWHTAALLTADSRNGTPAAENQTPWNEPVLRFLYGSA